MLRGLRSLVKPSCSNKLCSTFLSRVNLMSTTAAAASPSVTPSTAVPINVSSTPDLIITPGSNVVTIQLNRPKALNALNLPMCTEIRNMLIKWKNASQPEVGAFIVKGVGGKAFCAGGDVKSIWQDIQDVKKSNDATAVATLGTGRPGKLYSDFFRVEYQMNYLLGTSTIPQVSLWNGIVMGGGVGISVLGEFRVATENTMFAMPETSIGLFPDVGSSGWLPHLKNGFGLYIGLTGVRLHAFDLIYSGIATHFIQSDRLNDCEAQIARTVTSDPSASRKEIKKLLKSLTEGIEADKSKSVLQPNEEAIKLCFENATSIEQIMSKLQSEVDKGNAWAKTTLDGLKKVSPMSLKITLAQLLRGKEMDLKNCFEMEYRMVSGCMRAPDFSEGVRALLVDKDNKPAWNPASHEHVTVEEVDAYFKPLGEFDIQLNL